MTFLKAAAVAALAVLAVCVMPLALSQSNYESQTAAQKSAWLWGQITSNTLPGGWPSAWALSKLFLEDMNLSMDTKSDVMPSGRQKLIHSVGATAAIKFVPEPSSNYTGIFQGSNYGFARCSLAAQPADATSNDPVKYGMVPGCGFKFLRDGMYSANFVAMRALSPQSSFNFFRNTFSNHVSDAGLSFALQLLAKKFGTASSWATFVGLSDLATYGENGQQVSNPSFPFQLLLQPNPELVTKFPDGRTSNWVDYLTQLTSVGANTLLWDVYAKDTHDEIPVKIGSFVTTSAFVTSHFADTTMFFKHQRFEEDIKLRKEFLNNCASKDSCKVCPLDIDC